MLLLIYQFWANTEGCIVIVYGFRQVSSQLILKYLIIIITLPLRASALGPSEQNSSSYFYYRFATKLMDMLFNCSLQLCIITTIMGQCEVCTQELQYNLLDRQVLFKQIAETDLAKDIQKLKNDNQQYIKKFKVTLLPDKTHYRGDIVNQKKEGYAQLYAPTFNYYGFFKDNLPHGTGTILTDKQCIFGEFANGLINGQGKEWTLKHRFQGMYQKGDRVQGSLLRDELTYTGTFKNELFQGKGRLNLKDETCYEGQFKEGKFEGKGSLKFANKNSYYGGFKNGLYHGYGQFKWSNGNEYKGLYVEGEREGYGVMIVDTIQYVGHWKKGVREGRGFLYQSGEQVFGEWKDNHLIEH